MDRRGNIYEFTDDQIAQLNGTDGTDGAAEKAKAVELAEDVARLDGYLRGRADADRLRNGGDCDPPEETRFDSDTTRGPGANRDLAG